MRESTSVEDLFEKYRRECDEKEKIKKKKDKNRKKQGKQTKENAKLNPKSNSNDKKRQGENIESNLISQQTKKRKVETTVKENGYVLSKEIDSFIDMEDDEVLITTGYFYNTKDRFLNSYLDRDFLPEKDEISEDEEIEEESNLSNQNTKESIDEIEDEDELLDDIDLSSNIVTGKRTRKQVDRSFEITYWKGLIEDDEISFSDSEEDEILEEKDYGFEEDEEEDDNMDDDIKADKDKTRISCKMAKNNGNEQSKNEAEFETRKIDKVKKNSTKEKTQKVMNGEKKKNKSERNIKTKENNQIRKSITKRKSENPKKSEKMNEIENFESKVDKKNDLSYLNNSKTTDNTNENNNSSNNTNEINFAKNNDKPNEWDNRLIGVGIQLNEPNCDIKEKDDTIRLNNSSLEKNDLNNSDKLNNLDNLIGRNNHSEKKEIENSKIASQDESSITNNEIIKCN